MQVDYAQLKDRSPAVTAAIADARSARNLLTRREREAKTEEIEAARGRRRRRQKEKEELLTQVSRRVRVDMPEKQRSKIGGRTARKLFERSSGLLPGLWGFSNARGADGFYSIHFDFTPRGFASTKGRSWRTGEGERAARYITREEGLEGGEHGWWSNIAEDRTELVGFFRTVEALEKHDRSNANVYVSEIIALPAELSARQRRKAVRRICRFFERRGLGYVAAMHLPNKAGDQRNFHCHILYSLRACERHGAYDWSFAVAKEADINTPDGIAARRCTIVSDINVTLRAANIDKRYTPLSNKARGMAAAEPNLGQVGTWLARRIAALEAWSALAKKVQHLARQLRTALTAANEKLVRLGSQIEGRRTEVARQGVIVHRARASQTVSTDRLAPMAHVGSQRLKQHRTVVDLAIANAATATAQCRQQLARHLEACKTVVVEEVNTAGCRVRDAGRVRQLQDMRARIDKVQSVCAVRTSAIATMLPDRLRSTLAAILQKDSQAAAGVVEAKRKTGSMLQVRRDHLADSLAASDDRLGRAADRRDAIDALWTKRHALEDADADRHQRSLLYLPAWRRVAAGRLRAMRTAVEAPRELAVPRAVVMARLSDLRSSTALRLNDLDERLAAAWQEGRRIAKKGIGKGPAQGSNPVAICKLPAHRREVLEAPAVAPAAEPTSSLSAEAMPRRRRSDVVERVRELVRMRQPDPTLEMFPPPGARPPVPPDALLLAAERMELLRTEVGRREKRVREALRKQALDRLARLNIPVGVNVHGEYEVATGILLDEEMRVLMDPSAHEETQRLLAGIARRQHDRVMEQAVRPLVPQATLAAQPSSITRDLDLGTLAAAAKKTKETGKG